MKKILFLFVCIVVFTSCNTTKITSSWSVRNPPSDIMNKVLVVAVMVDREGKDRTEHAMVEELKKYGIDAYSALDMFGPKSFNASNEEEIATRLRGSQFTSVMIVSLVNKEKNLRYVPGSYSYYGSPYYYGSRRYYRRYWALYDQVYTPGYYTTSTNYVLEADIYTVNDDDELIYSPQTRSTDPGSAHSLAESFSKTIVTELREKGLVPDRHR